MVGIEEKCGSEQRLAKLSIVVQACLKKAWKRENKGSVMRP